MEGQGVRFRLHRSRLRATIHAPNHNHHVVGAFPLRGALAQMLAAQPVQHRPVPLQRHLPLRLGQGVLTPLPPDRKPFLELPANPARLDAEVRRDLLGRFLKLRQFPNVVEFDLNRWLAHVG
jgi:hypothetical protein